MSFNVLHLSDIHFGRNDPRYGLKDNFEKHDEILDGIIDVIGGMDDALKPEHIVFTGDIAWHGKTREYTEALAWFKRLLDAAHLSGKDISFCVGNHDLDLACRCDAGDLDDNSIAAIDELYRYENIRKMEPRLYAYNNFCRELGVEPYSYPLHGRREYSYSAGYKDVTFASGGKLRILALNTAHLLAQGNISEDKMWLGREQILALKRYEILPAGDAAYSIALFHHADRFLHPNETNTYDDRDATLPLLLSCVNLAISGHTESMGKARLSKQFGGGAMLQGGAAYYSDDHMNSFSMIYISEKTKKAGFIPYVYENGWRDFEFGQRELTDVKQIEEEGTVYRNGTLSFRAGDALSFTVNISFFEQKTIPKEDGSHICLNNRKAFFDPFCVECCERADGGREAVLSVSDSQRHSVDGLLSYMEYADFVSRTKDCSNRSVTAYDENGAVIFSADAYTAASDVPFSRQELADLSRIEKELDLKFHLPDKIGDTDRETIAYILSKLERTAPEKEDPCKEQMELFDNVFVI